MDITTLKKVLPVLLDSKLTAWIWGFHGKGKSETVETWCKDLGYLCFNFRLNTQADVGDFLGLQDFTVDSKGQKISTTFFKPDWLSQCFMFCEANPTKKAVIFIDEINRAPRMDLIGPVFQMALDHRLHTYVFPKNLHIICAANPDTANYSVLSLDDKALFSRFVHIYFNPSVEEWREYAISKEYDSSILDFISEHPDFLEEKDLEKFSIQEYAKPDRRKYGGIDKLKKSKVLTKNELHEIASGMIGIEAATAYIKSLDRADKPLSLADILDLYPTTQVKVKKYTKENQQAILHNVNQKVKEHFTAGGKITQEQGNNVYEYLLDLPLGLFFELAHSIYKCREFFQHLEKDEPRKAKFIKKLHQAKGEVKKKEEVKTEQVPF